MADFKTIRLWDGSQDRAFEELCYQLREEAPSGATLIKTGDPDSGLEWYVRHRNGIEWGWQAKYSFEIDTLLKLMEKSLKTVVEKRPSCRKLTFCIPFDLPDARGGDERKSARQKFEDRKESWAQRIDGADRVTIELVSAGGLLERLTGHPNERGITWFFWDKEVFAQDWLERRLAVTIAAAGPRYSPTLHVDLPVAFALEGLASSDAFWDRYRDRRANVLAASSRVNAGRYTGLGVTSQLRHLQSLAKDWEARTPAAVRAPDRIARADLLERCRALRSAVQEAFPSEAPQPEGAGGRARNTEDRKALSYHLMRLASALSEFSSFLQTGAAKADERGGLLLTGEAGQGKTHLLCDVGAQALGAGAPAIVLLGGRLSGRHFWSDCAECLGLPQVGGEVLLGGMRAAAEAGGRPFLLLVDALNESAEPGGWRDDLPALLAELNGDPWIRLAVSVRSTFLPVVLPDGGVGDFLAVVDHPGFAGRELEATERFFDAFQLDQPRVPLLTPEFTNPLFLKLYCEGLRGLGLSAPPAGEAHISDVFARHLEWKARRIAQTLALDPDSHVVERAVDKFSEELVSRNAEHLPRLDAAELVNEFAPALHEWPRTLFGQLLDEGVLANDVAWTRESEQPIEVVRFVYQRFADYRVAGALLEPFKTEAALRAALRTGEPLRETIRTAPAGWIEALSVLVPERYGIELLDAANWSLRNYKRQRWEHSLVRSVVSRRPEATSDRALDLMFAAERRSRYLSDEVFEAILTLAPMLDHPLNADYLHQVLMKVALPDRDAWWSIRTYHALGLEGPLDRLIRWAARGPYTESPDGVLRLAGTAIVWTFTSPNRFMRDYATKALRQLLDHRLPVLTDLVRQFRECDDIYVIERLATVVHGSLLTAGHLDRDGALTLARAARDCFLDNELTPNILVRDAVRGCFEWALRDGLIEEGEYVDVRPPYGSVKPEKPRTKKQLERSYGRYRRDRQGNYAGSPYGSLFFSIFDHGDFARYVIEPKIRRFTNLPLSKAITEPAEPEPDAEQLEAFLKALPQELQGTTDLAALVAGLDDSQIQELRNIVDPPRPLPLRVTNRYPAELAQRWIFERVLLLGWTDRFYNFETTYGRGHARESHKTERFGKKYQWIALRELVARIADNFHMAGDWSDYVGSYEGPWQFYGRDIDPTLPPAPRYRDDEDDVVRVGPTFANDPLGVWWDPGGPRFLRTDPPLEVDWAATSEDLPSFEQLVRRRDPAGENWIVLLAYYNWDEEQPPGSIWRSDGFRRDAWTYVFSWLVHAGQLESLVAHLSKRSFMGRWMPEGGEITNDAYLGEMPWAAAANEYPKEVESVRPLGDGDPEFEVVPSWEGYTWEGVTLDCSIEDTVNTSVPAPALFALDPLRHVPATCDWVNANGDVVAQHRSCDGGHRALLVRESWLRALLTKGSWGLVIGSFGEKMLLAERSWSGPVGAWTELNGVGSFDGRRLVVGETATRLVSQRTDGRDDSAE